MTLGLAAFLERIRSQPQNEVLLDRFLLLVADMDDSEEKATLLLEFVSVIRQEHPKFALQILRQVHRQVECSWVQHPQELAMQSLQVLHDTMLALGREARAGLIANEMQRLREHPLTEGSIGSSSIQGHLEPVHEENFARKRGKGVEKGRVQQKPHPFQMEPQLDELHSHTMPDEPRTNPFVMPLENDAGEAMAQNPQVPDSGPEVDNMTFRDMRKLFRVFDAYIKDEKPIEAKNSLPLAVAEIPVAPPIAQKTSLVERLFGSVMHIQDAVDPLTPHFMSLSKTLGWKLRHKDAKRIAVLVRNEESPLWLVSLWFAIGSQGVRAWFEDGNMGEDLFPAWEECMTFMIEHRMFRRALIFIRVSVDEQMHPNNALATYQYLKVIWKGLYLRGFSWQPEEGVPSLTAKLTSREQPLCQNLLFAS